MSSSSRWGTRRRRRSCRSTARASRSSRRWGTWRWAAAARAGGWSPAERPDPKDVIDLHTGMQRARQLADDGLFEPAVDALERVLKRDPNNLAALIDLASAQAGQGRLDDAVATVERALALDPDYPRLSLQLASLEARRGDRERALELVDHALSLDASLPEAWIQKAQLLAQGSGERGNRGRRQRVDEVAAVLEQARETVGETARLLAVTASLVDLARGDLDAAGEHVRRALEMDPFLAAGLAPPGQGPGGARRPGGGRAELP